MKIAYVGPYRVDSDSPGLQRVLGVSAALANAGHHVLIGGQASAPTLPSPHAGVALKGFVATGGRMSRVLNGHGVAEWLASLSSSTDVCIVYGGSGPFTSAVKRWADAQGVPRIIDSVEWYSPNHSRWGLLNPRVVDNEYSMRVRYPRYDGAIAISRYLERHYARTGTPTLRLPPLTDVLAVELGDKAPQGPLQIVYAGTPANKDILGTIVRAAQSMDPGGRRVQLDILGVTQAQAAVLPQLADLGPSPAVNYYGRVSRIEVLTRVAQADYIPMVRPNRRFAHAGFPTKVVEAMAAGTAVLGNHTSDLDEHVRHLETGLVIGDSSPEEIVHGLESAVKGGHKLARVLGRAARAHAEQAFHFTRHVEALDRWIGDVKRGV